MSETPRTDAELEKTYIPKYEYEGAETIAWEWARALEKELGEITEDRDYYRDALRSAENRELNHLRKIEEASK